VRLIWSGDIYKMGFSNPVNGTMLRTVVNRAEVNVSVNKYF